MSTLFLSLFLSPVFLSVCLLYTVHIFTMFQLYFCLSGQPSFFPSICLSVSLFLLYDRSRLRCSLHWLLRLHVSFNEPLTSGKLQGSKRTLRMSPCRKRLQVELPRPNVLSCCFLELNSLMLHWLFIFQLWHHDLGTDLPNCPPALFPTAYCNAEAEMESPVERHFCLIVNVWY